MAFLQFAVNISVVWLLMTPTFSVSLGCKYSYCQRFSERAPMEIGKNVYGTRSWGRAQGNTLPMGQIGNGRQLEARLGTIDAITLQSNDLRAHEKEILETVIPSVLKSIDWEQTANENLQGKLDDETELTSRADGSTLKQIAQMVAVPAEEYARKNFPWREELQNYYRNELNKAK